MVVTKKAIAKKKVVKKIVKKSASKKTSPAKVKKTIRRKSIKNNVTLESNLEANMPDEALINNDINESALKNNVLYSWEAPEFFYHAKPAYWHLVIYSGVAILTILMLLFKQWFAVPVFILLGILVFQYSEVRPKIISVTITDLGILISNKFYPFSEIKSFWVLYKPPIKQLNLELTKRFSPIMSILLEDTDPVIIKDLLSPHIIQDSGRSEDLLDKLIRMLRF